jgi:hypothetical protein
MSKPPVKTYPVGTMVAWQWGRGTAYAVIKEVHTTPTTITSKGGTQVTRKASPANPAYTLRQPDKPHPILKSHSEVRDSD